MLFHRYKIANRGKGAMMGNSKAAKPAPSLAEVGVISPANLYSLPEVRRRLQWGDAAMRAARRRGLKIKYVAGHGYVLGSEVIRHITETGKDTK